MCVCVCVRVDPNGWRGTSYHFMAKTIEALSDFMCGSDDGRPGQDGRPDPVSAIRKVLPASERVLICFVPIGRRAGQSGATGQRTYAHDACGNATMPANPRRNREGGNKTKR